MNKADICKRSFGPNVKNPKILKKDDSQAVILYDGFFVRMPELSHQPFSEYTDITKIVKVGDFFYRASWTAFRKTTLEEKEEWAQLIAKSDLLKEFGISLDDGIQKTSLEEDKNEKLAS